MFTLLFSLAIAFHLSLFNLLPTFGYKWIGDLFLFFIIILSLPKGYLLPIKSLRFLYFLSLFFLGYVFFLIIYTSLMWHINICLVVIWARRWLIFGLYLIILYSRLSLIINHKYLYITLLLGCIISLFSDILVKYIDISIPGIKTVIQFQGGIIVKKMFSYTNFLIFSFVILYFWKIISKRLNPLKFWFFIIYIAVTNMIINFRSWWLMAIFFIALYVLFLGNYKEKKHSLLVALLLIFVIFIFSILKVDLIYHKISWIISVFKDFYNMEGTWHVRYYNDITKLLILLKDKNIAHFILGVGFIPEDSKAAYILGFSSETNDVGFIELLLTGGIMGFMLLFLIWLNSINIMYKEMNISSTYTLKASITLWTIAVVLMVSSNPLLWEFGFVPLVTFALIARSEVYILLKRNK